MFEQRRNGSSRMSQEDKSGRASLSKCEKNALTARSLSYGLEFGSSQLKSMPIYVMCLSDYSLWVQGTPSYNKPFLFRNRYVVQHKWHIFGKRRKFSMIPRRFYKSIQQNCKLFCTPHLTLTKVPPSLVYSLKLASQRLRLRYSRSRQLDVAEIETPSLFAVEACIDIRMMIRPSGRRAVTMTCKKIQPIKLQTRRLNGSPKSKDLPREKQKHRCRN